MAAPQPGKCLLLTMFPQFVQVYLSCSSSKCVLLMSVCASINQKLLRQLQSAADEVQLRQFKLAGCARDAEPQYGTERPYVRGMQCVLQQQSVAPGRRPAGSPLLSYQQHLPRAGTIQAGTTNAQSSLFCHRVMLCSHGLVCYETLCVLLARCAAAAGCSDGLCVWPLDRARLAACCLLSCIFAAHPPPLQQPHRQIQPLRTSSFLPLYALLCRTALLWPCKGPLRCNNLRLCLLGVLQQQAAVMDSVLDPSTRARLAACRLLSCCFAAPLPHCSSHTGQYSHYAQFILSASVCSSCVLHSYGIVCWKTLSCCAC
jgi:hypothetical protein